MNIKSNKGVTLIGLTITIIVLLILASITTYSGLNTIKSSKLNKFEQELEIMQAEVNLLYEKYKEDLQNNVEVNIGKEIPSEKQEQANTAFDVCGVAETTGYKLFDAEVINALNIEGIEREYLVNISKKDVICLEGLEVDGVIYYNLEDITEKNKITETLERGDVTFSVTATDKKIELNDIAFSKYVGKGMIQYKLKGADIWTTLETDFRGDSYSFDVESSGIYTVRITDAAKNYAEIDVSVLLPSSNVTTPYFPNTDYSQLEGTDLETGLVIRDKPGNEYVWIEVPKTTTVYPTAGIEITEFTDTEYEIIEEDLKAYTTTYRNETTFNDEYYSDETTGLTKEEYNNLKEKMLKSVYESGGFWIGRYEVGIENSFRDYGDGHATEHPATETPVIKANAYPYNWVNCSQAQTLASTFAPSEYESSLMFGLQWDLVLKYLEEKTVSKGVEVATIQSELGTNSTKWGNYYNNTYNITNTSAKYSADEGVSWANAPYNKETSKVTLLTIAADESFSKQNIYDLVGNLWKFTLEYSANSSSPSSCRGGGCYSDGSVSPANAHYSDSAIYSSNSIGFRVSLY